MYYIQPKKKSEHLIYSLHECPLGTLVQSRAGPWGHWKGRHSQTWPTATRRPQRVGATGCVNPRRLTSEVAEYHQETHGKLICLKFEMLNRWKLQPHI